MTPGTRSGPIVAIDGAAGSGKSTLARRLADALDLPYVNTGLMYREATRSALAEGLDVHDGVALAQLARDLRFELDWRARPPSLLIRGTHPGDDLLTPEVEANVSAVSRHPEVRTVMAAAQRGLGSRGAVMEGRDIGSVIFPDAEVKLFLEAAEPERVSRRSRERPEARRVGEWLSARDALDSKVNPFVPAEGAVRIDTTGHTIDETLETALAIASARLGGHRE